MKTLKSWGALTYFALGTILTSCYDHNVTGTLVLNQNVNLLKETQESSVPVEISAGQFPATAKLRDNNTTLYISIADGKTNPLIKFDLPSGVSMRQGEFTVTPKQGGQPFGLHGLVHSEYINSNSMESWQSCYINCGYSPYPRPTPPYPYPGCYPGSYWGHQRVRYHILTTLTKYEVQLQNNEKTEAGKFTAQDQYDEQVIESLGFCQ